jgi:integrase
LGQDYLNVKELNLALLNGLVDYLRKPHKVVQLKRQLTLPALTETAIANYIGKIKQIFRAATDEFNNEEIGAILIPNNPFRKFKMPKISQPQKRNVKLDVIKAIRDAGDLKRSRLFGRDMFMLTFYLVGINAKDLFNATEIKDGRLTYFRAKTLSRKQARSYVSIKIEPEAMAIIEHYRDVTGARVFDFYRRYNNNNGFTHAVNTGLQKLCTDLGIKEKITTYNARHSWATIARNVCKVSKDDIGFALNHSDGANKTTDLYIEEDYSIVDDANRKVLDSVL